MIISSENIKIYPTSKRNSTYIESRINTENNLTNIVRRSTDRPYRLNGLLVSGDTSSVTITGGVCTLGGYSLDISEDMNVDVESASITDSYLCLRIKVDTNRGDGELDVNDAYDSGLGYDVFSGVEIEQLSEGDYNTLKGDNFKRVVADEIDYLLPLAYYDTEWNNIETNHLKYSSESVYINNNKPGFDYYEKEQDLKEFLNDNYVIDDGDIE